ncbi:MAG: hypothetical protein RML72_10570 [Bacteroidia bacterium]|nr:hypothetical protein [Bacteroidia bacterium]MDW8159302.1 hypothetical protein [Bacteroidia bacterium]
MLQQIVPWLSVPALVIDVGADISAIQEVENLEANCPIYIQLQNVSQKGENYILSLYEIPNSLYELSEEFAFLELRCAPPWPPLPTNCFINIDYCSIEEAITVKPFGISAGKVINSPNLQLDFDKLDNLRYRLGLECD